MKQSRVETKPCKTTDKKKATLLTDLIDWQFKVYETGKDGLVFKTTDLQLFYAMKSALGIKS